MPRRDISPRDKSIRNISLPGTHKKQVSRTYADDDVLPKKEKAPKVVLPKKSGLGWWWAGGLVVACALLGLMLSSVFEGARIIVTPKTVPITDSQTLTAQPGGPAGTLTYQKLTAIQSASTSVAANGTQRVSRAATGVVTITNTFSTASQKLSAGTRLTTNDNKIYFLRTATTVPGQTKKADGTLVPGSVTVSVYAEKPGAEYNTTAPIQLSILGFKGTAKYSKFLVQSRGPLTGGFVGDEPAISPADLASAQNELKRQLDQNIRSLATSQIPEGFVGITGSLSLVYTDVSQAPGSNNTTILSQGVTATLVIVRLSDVAGALAHQVGSQTYRGEPVGFLNPSTLTVTLSGAATGTPGPLTLVITGNPTLVWLFDTDALQKALLGKPKSEFQAIISRFQPAIQRAEAQLKPLWRANLPDTPEKLEIVIKQ